MSNLTIFREKVPAVSVALRESTMGKRIAETMGGFSRITTSTNGTFKRIVNGEQVGRPIRGEFNAIIIGMQDKPGRTYYATEYDPDAKPTLPDCWSNLGDKPDPKAGDRQSTNCASCPQNIEGSARNGKYKACRFQRKVALLLEGDERNEVYQFQIPAKSLFGKGDGNTHPFESYCRFLVANGTAPDRVVTCIAYNLDAETMELNFTPVRPITDEELDLVDEAQGNPATERLTLIAVGDSKPRGEDDAPKPKAKPKPAPVDEDEEEAPKPKAKPKPAPVDEDEEVEEPKVTKRATKAEKPEPKGNLASVMDAWDEEDED